MNWTPFLRWASCGQPQRQGRQAYHIAILCIGEEAGWQTLRAQLSSTKKADEWCPKISARWMRWVHVIHQQSAGMLPDQYLRTCTRSMDIIDVIHCMVGWYRFGSQSVDESKNGSLSQSVLKLTNGEIGLCSVALCGVGQWRQWRTIKMNQFRHRRHWKITMGSLIKCPGLGRYRCAFLMCFLSLLS